jgi:hypothetical protein
MMRFCNNLNYFVPLSVKILEKPNNKSLWEQVKQGSKQDVLKLAIVTYLRENDVSFE